MSEGRRAYHDGWTPRTMAIAYKNSGAKGLANCLRQSCEKFMGANHGEYVDDIFADALEVVAALSARKGENVNDCDHMFESGVCSNCGDKSAITTLESSIKDPPIKELQRPAVPYETPREKIARLEAELEEARKLIDREREMWQDKQTKLEDAEADASGLRVENEALTADAHGCMDERDALAKVAGEVAGILGLQGDPSMWELADKLTAAVKGES